MMILILVQTAQHGNLIMKTKHNTILLLTAALFGLAALSVQAQDSFGSGANTFTIDFVEIGSPGNAAQSSSNRTHTQSGGDGYGAVETTFRMSTHAISTDMIDKANAEGTLGITRTNRSANLPATEVSWNQAARFVNFLNEQAGYSHAYKFEFQPGDVGYGSNQNIQLWDINDPGYNPDNLYRNNNAFYFLPSENEWFKAGYFDPVSGQYSLYATGSDTVPTAVASGTSPGTAVYNGQSGPADVTQAGGLSPFGTMGQNGNIYEWMESAFDGVNNLTNESRGIRGGSWFNSEFSLRSSIRYISTFPRSSSNSSVFAWPVSLNRLPSF